MAKVVTAIIATVELVTAPKEGQYGPYCSVLFKDESGEKIWKSFDPDSEELTYLAKGTKVQLVPAGERNGKVSHNIVLLESAQAGQSNRNDDQPPQLPPSKSGMSPELKRQIAAYIDEQSDLLRFCWITAKVKLENIATDEESFRTAASTLYLSAQRKFGL